MFPLGVTADSDVDDYRSGPGVEWRLDEGGGYKSQLIDDTADRGLGVETNEARRVNWTG